MRKIKQISVTNLFGIFDHIIPLNVNDRVTIIHSPNGFGKTVLLRMLNELFSQGYRVLRATPYDEFKIVFEDGSQLWITRKTESDPENKTQSNTKINPTAKLTFHYRNNKKEEQSFVLKPASWREARDYLPLSAIENFIPHLDRVGTDAWKDLSRGITLSFSEVFEIYGERLSEITGSQMPYEKEPDWLRQLRGSIPLRLIETQRLLNPSRANKPNRHERSSAMTPTVTMYSEELAETIKTKLAESTDLAQSLDRTFPRRLVSSATRQSDITETELRNKLAELETKRANLMAAGLIDKDDNDAVQVTDTIDASTKAVLSVYIEDVEQKLGVFDEIANKIDLLKRIINKRFLYKEMTISRRDGFVFITTSKSRLNLESLSSGEQHELVLFYELLFKASPGSLILVDEPEISLHVFWQEQFLKDVQEITQLANLDVLIATHSPDIIDGQRDLVVQLEGPNNGKL